MGVDPIPGLDLAWAKIRRSLKMGVLHMGPPYKWPEINGPHNCFFFFNPYKWRDTQAPYNWYGRGPSCWVDFGVF